MPSSDKIAPTPTITENDIEPRFERFGSQHTPAVPLVSDPTSQDSPKRNLPTLTDGTFPVTANGEGA